MAGADLHRFGRRASVFGLCLFLISCSTLPLTIRPVNPPVAPADFLGVTDLPEASGSDRIRILFIHGIGEHTACDPDTLLRHLSKALNVAIEVPSTIQPGTNCAIPAPAPTPVPGHNAQDTALLYRYDLASERRRVTFMFLLWSPLTKIPKQSLVEPDLPHRSLLADDVKAFEQDNLADVLLYGGKYREVIRPAIQRGLCLFVEGTPGASDPRICDGGETEIPTAIITHSLGGYILMDALHDLYSHRGDSHRGATRNAAVFVGHDLNQVFMLANQLKMLDLTTRVSEFQSPHMASDFHKYWNETYHPSDHAPYVVKRQLLAISDPNDILSWEVTRDEFNRADLTVANIYLGTTGEFFGVDHTPILGLVANPVSAHLNYLSDDEVMNIVACGLHGSQIRPCEQ